MTMSCILAIFGRYIIGSTALTVDGCASILLGKLPSMPSYVVRCSLLNVNFDWALDIGSDLRFLHQNSL